MFQKLCPSSSLAALESTPMTVPDHIHSSWRVWTWQWIWFCCRSHFPLYIHQCEHSIRSYYWLALSLTLLFPVTSVMFLRPKSTAQSSTHGCLPQLELLLQGSSFLSCLLVLLLDMIHPLASNFDFASDPMFYLFHKFVVVFPKLNCDLGIGSPCVWTTPGQAKRNTCNVSGFGLGLQIFNVEVYSG